MDTNVLVAAMRSSRGASFAILQRLRAGDWRCVLSNHLLFEYEEKLTETARLLGVAVADVQGTLTVICAHAEEFQLQPH